MTYKVVYKFKDLQDNGYIYEVGDSYPRKGYEPPAERIDELSSKDNKIGKALIIKIEPKEEPKEETPKETTTKEEKAVKTAKNVSKKQKKKVGD